MKRFSLFCFLCVTLLLVVIFGVINAEETILGSGSCGENLTWTLSSTGELRISGAGDMQNYPNVSAPWYELRNEITSVIIETGVTSIGDSVFQDCTYLSNIIIPEGITYIGGASFSNCSNLSGIVFPESLTFLGDAFYACNKLTNITLPGAIMTVGGGAFVNCGGLKTIEFNEGITTIDIVAFALCNQLTTISLPLSLQSINDNAFWGCDQLSNVFYNGSAEQWEEITFGTGNDSLFLATRNYGAPQDEFGTLSVGLVQNGQLSLSNLFAPWGETITVTATPDLGYALTAIQVDGVDIAGNTFVVSGNHVVTATFEVKTLTLSVGVVVNGHVTLSNQSLLYGSTVTVTATPNIGYELASIQVDGVNIEGNTFVVISDHVVTATFTQNGVLLASGTSGNIEWGVFNTGHLLIRGSGPMPAGSPWSAYSYLISSLEILDGVISIGDSAFYGCRSLRSAIIPGSITSIGSSAFSGCSSLTSLPIPNSVTSIGGYAFSDCRSLIGIIIPEGVNVVGDYTFSGCSSLLSVAIPNSVTSIRYQAFRDCKSLINITIPSSVTSIGSNAFDGCISLTSVIIPSSVTSLGDNAFSYCSSLESISIPNSVTAIDGGTFYGCSSLKNIILPTNLTYIGHYAFYGCSSLTNIILPTSLTYIGQYAFYGCSGLENITIPNGISMIWEYTFSGCHNLKSVTIPSSVTTVWDNAFSGCGQIGKVFCNGAEGNWEKIFIEIGNETLTNATRYYGVPEDYRNITIGSVSNGSIELSNSFCLVESIVTVTATPNIGCELVNIQVDGIDIEGNTFVVSSDHIVTAIFELKTFTATVGNIENGQVYLSNQMPQYGSTVTVTATPNNSYQLVSIQVDGVNILGNTFVVSGDHVVTATFELRTFAATVGTIVNGQVSLSNQFPQYGSTVSVTATPNIGYELVSIQVDGVNILGNTFVVSGDHVVTATFEVKTFTATVGNIENGQVSLSNQIPQYGSIVTITTTANTGYTLVGIQVDGVNIVGNTFVVSGDHVVTATFELRTFALTVGDVVNGQVSMSNQFPQYGSTVTVTAIPKIGYELVNIQIDGEDIEGNTFVVTDNHVITATFAQTGILLASGTSNNIEWGLFDTGHLLIRGSGPMPAYYNTGSPWYSYSSSIRSLEILNGVTSIGDSAFYGCRSLISVEIPGSVTSVGNSAFSDCNSLRNITIPSSVNAIGYTAFYGCRSLISITIPDGVSSIRENTFYGCSSLASMTLPSNITSIGPNAFAECKSLMNITIPEGVTSIEDYAFSNCSSLTNITIPSSVTSIKYAAFNGCSMLASVTIPNNVTSIGSRAFYGCSSLTNIIIPSGVTAIEDSTFSGCNSLTDITLPSSLTYIGNYAFQSCWGLTSLTFPNSVTYIGNYAFYGCSRLNSVTIPSGMASIWENSFYGCSSLTSVTIPSSITSIWDNAFYGCEQISKVFYSGMAENWTKISIASGNDSISIATRYFGTPEDYSNITIGSVQNGSITINNSFCLIGSTATVTTTPNIGYELVNIQVDGVDIEGNTFVVSGDHVVTATFELKTFAVTVGNIENGLVSLSNTLLEYGSTVTVTATPNANYKLVSIHVDGANIEGNTFVVSNDHVVTATFELKTFTATVGAVINGQVSLSNQYPQHGSTVTVTAIPNIGYDLTAIQVDGVDIEGNTFVVSKDHVVTATFELKTFTTSVGTVLNGQVSLSNLTPQYGSTVSVITTPNPGYDLVSIQVDGANIEGNTFVVSNDHVVTATFELKTYTATVGTVANGQLSLSNQSPQYGSIVTITATPDIGYDLVAIQVDGVDIEGNSFVASGNHVVTATFVQYGVLVASGGCGLDVKWGLFDTGHLVIRGSGPMSDYYDSSITPWYLFWSEVKSVEILSGVTSVGNYAFANLRNLSSVMIPCSVTTIGGFAFIGCSNLTNILIPESVTEIKERAFYVCNNLTSVVIPNSVTTIGGFAFYGCSKLTSIVIPENVTTIGSDAFAFCTSLTSVVIPVGVTSIEASTFYNCSNLTSVTIPGSVTWIGERAFQACNNLTNVVIPGSVTWIGNYAFASCDSLTKVIFEGHAPTSIGFEVFPTISAGGFLIYYSNDKTGWTSPMWKGYFTSVLGSSLNDYSVLDEKNTNVQGIVFTLNDQSNTASVGDNSTNHNNSGYYGAHSGKVVIPASVTKSSKTYKVIGIGQNAFSNNKLLTSIELGANITSIDTTAFSNCNSLDSILVSPSNTQFKSVDGILFDSVSYYLYIYPSAKPGTAYTVPESVKTIGTKAFYGNKNLLDVSVPNSVTSIGLGAFDACSNLKTITLPYIGRNSTSQDTFAFVFGSAGGWDNRVPASLESITITGGTLKTGSFENLPDIKNLTLPAIGTAIPAYSFSGCSSLQSIIFMETKAISEVGQVVLPEQITTIGDFAFYGCSSLESVIILEGVTSIGNQAFSGCINLGSFNVHEDNPSYHTDKWGVLFTKDLSTLICYPSNRIWPYYNVPNETTTLQTGAFEACANLVNLYIPATVTNLQSSCISNCPGVMICVYLNSSAHAFAGNNNLTAWYMDNYTLQGIEIYSLPEDTVYPLGQEDFSGLYLVADYGGKQLQLDDYELNYDMNLLGLQTVTVEHSAGTASFEIVLFDATSEQVLDFGAVVAPEGTMALVAVYDEFGRMICIESAIINNSQGKAVISNNDYNKMSKAKLFVLDGLNLAPQRQEYRIHK